jgi:Fe-S-cluster containining protein
LETHEPLTEDARSALADIPDCQSCGACCSFSREWPRFTLETDAEIARIPAEFMNETTSRMRCVGDRCTALIGKIGVATSCSIYDIRPDVCRACEPGDDACRMARIHFGMEPISPGD